MGPVLRTETKWATFEASAAAASKFPPEIYYGIPKGRLFSQVVLSPCTLLSTSHVLFSQLPMYCFPS